jgi:hypothetical protein
MSTDKTVAKSAIPKEGVVLQASPGNKFTRLHLDLADDGITLAMAGAASALANRASRHQILLKRAKEGITLSMVGAASSVR